MKIDNTNVSGTSAERLEQNRATAVVRTGYDRAGRTGSGGNSGNGDQIDLSGLSRALSAASSESPERVAQVEQLSEIYAAGNYRVDAEEVSRRIVEDAQRP